MLCFLIAMDAANVFGCSDLYFNSTFAGLIAGVSADRVVCNHSADEVSCMMDNAAWDSQRWMIEWQRKNFFKTIDLYQVWGCILSLERAKCL